MEVVLIGLQLMKDQFQFKYVLSNLNLINFKAKSTGYKKENNIGVISNYADLTIDNCIF